MTNQPVVVNVWFTHRELFYCSKIKHQLVIQDKEKDRKKSKFKFTEKKNVITVPLSHNKVVQLLVNSNSRISARVGLKKAKEYLFVLEIGVMTLLNSLV